ncbi:MAG: hypothetical protein HC824_13345 [Synechococcales cyanobacterium RM1_1_8]|nr:hypothetical protein [Synechococcales cyanobacterium RM1_1_8]
MVGPCQPPDVEGYVAAISQLSEGLGWPILSDALNPLRNFAAQLPGLICHYDGILRQAPELNPRDPEQRDPDQLAAHTAASGLVPTTVLRLGELPTSKVLRQWLAQLSCEQWIVSDRPGNFDPLHGPSRHLRCDLGHLAAQLSGSIPRQVSSPVPRPDSNYRKRWLALDRQAEAAIDRAMAPLETLREPKLPWLLSQHLPEKTPLFIANSTPVRDLEWFWRRGDRAILPYVNRGANGIDGTLSTALGIAHRNRPSVMVTGDLALLHDTNGWLLSPQLQGHLTIILLNNNGGGIFELLPIARFDPPFEQFFAAPQRVDFAPLCQAYGATYEQILDWEQLRSRLNPLPTQGIRLLEIQSDRKGDVAWRSQLLQSVLAHDVNPSFR